MDGESYRALTQSGRDAITEILMAGRLLPTVAAKLPANWTQVWIPTEPEPGVYLIGDALLARPGWDDQDDHWRYLGDCDEYVHDMTWLNVWHTFGGAKARILQLSPELAVANDDGVTLPLQVTSVFGTQVSVSAYRPNLANGATLSLAIKGSQDAALSGEEALKLAAGLVQAVKRGKTPSGS